MTVRRVATLLAVSAVAATCCLDGSVALAGSSKASGTVSDAAVAQTYLTDQAPMGAAVMKMTYQLIDLKPTTKISVFDQDLTLGIASLVRFDAQLKGMGESAAPPAGAALATDSRDLADYIGALRTVRAARRPKKMKAALPAAKSTSAAWLAATVAVAQALGLPSAEQAGSSLLPAVTTLPAVPGIAPTAAYPGTAPNGWLAAKALSHGLLIPLGGCQAETTYELAWVERDYYYDESTTQDNADYGNGSIAVFVAATEAEAAAAERVALTSQYQECFAQQQEALLENADVAVTGTPTVTLVQSSVSGSPAFFSYAMSFLANGAQQTYYVSAAFFQVGQYRAIVEEDGCCTAAPLSFMEDMLAPTEAKMTTPPATGVIWEF